MGRHGGPSMGRMGNLITSACDVCMTYLSAFVKATIRALAVSVSYHNLSKCALKISSI